MYALRRVLKIFQSTLPARGSDRLFDNQPYKRVISIHAPRKGERLGKLIGVGKSTIFQSTLPARGSDELPTW